MEFEGPGTRPSYQSELNMLLPRHPTRVPNPTPMSEHGSQHHSDNAVVVEENDVGENLTKADLTISLDPRSESDGDEIVGGDEEAMVEFLFISVS